MRVQFSRQFKKQYKKAPRKIQTAIDRRLKLFIKDPDDPLLRNHSLRGRLKGFRSINITGDWRAVFREFEKENLIFFDTFGTHSQLYK
ncbi:type II toxin-antitoxin system mRNA interferase toxin, RelE/StbE family [Patescibacteria group bacterium]|nr:type II toxin-antitoxin system mRNA interferase toxin, RelE/StbE family [Patescibacteria group bacterium]